MTASYRELKGASVFITGGSVLFLASDASHAMTGQALVIDGGVAETG